MTEPVRKILVVDDEPQIVRVLKGYLENAGFRVISSMMVKMHWLFYKENPEFIISILTARNGRIGDLPENSRSIKCTNTYVTAVLRN